jgi:cellulose synthase operon protein YhjU
MGIWNFYFIAKLFLYFGRYMGFHVWLNLPFAIFLSIPIPERYKRLRPVRQIVAVPVGIALFYYDTWLPPITHVFSQASQLEGFSATYLLELVGRFFNPLAVGGLILLYAVYFFAAKKLRITSFVYLAMLIPLLSIGQPRLPTQPVDEFTTSAPDAADSSGAENSARSSDSAGTEGTTEKYFAPPTAANLTAQLNSFYVEESKRSVSFTSPPPSDAPFDIIILQICSLSWDDLDLTRERDNPLFKRFNIVFTNFSSAASYSGPAAIRLLRSSCGQTRHKALYDATAPQCLTFDDLQKIGFEPELALNHNGQYGGFLDELRERGGLMSPLFDTRGLPPYLQSFDGSPVHDDYAVLSKWWTKRMQSQAQRVALFYNTISLHDGNYYSGHRSNSLETYHPRLKQLLSDLDHFFNDLQASGRRAVVVFVPEHGAAIRGDKMQIAGLREIPTPRISIVPVGIKLIGLPEKPDARPLLVSKPVSYLAISKLLSDFITITPFGGSSLSMKDYVRDLPSTEFVSENEDVVVMRRGKQYFIHSRDADWVEYDNSE